MNDFIDDLEAFDALEKAEKQRDRETTWSEGLTYFDESDIYIREIEVN